MVTRLKGKSLALTAASVQLLPPNPRRKWLLVSPPPAGVLALGFGESSVTNPTLLVNNATSPFPVGREMVGDSITEAVFASVSVNGTCTIAEVTGD